MLFMESYLCYCSVRLGVMIVAVLAMLQNLTLSIFLFVQGVHIFDYLIDLMEQDAQYRSSSLVRKFIDWVHDAPDNVLIFLQVCCYLHILTAILGILNKWLLLPLALLELLTFLSYLILHIISMIVLKKKINLGLLIVLTLVGSFWCLFVGYNAVTCIAMYQIITLVRSSRYRQLYGEDPFHPLAMQRISAGKDSVQQLRMLQTPEETDIDEQKRLAKLAQWPKRRPQIISVIPVQAPAPQLKWWQLQALDKEARLDDSRVYRNWQRDELLRGVGGELERKNALNRRYAEDQQFRWH
ncbi:CG14007 [Drosophila busckii]|uniref:CG14007 n=1 Tax=Drosophila busckii TaxID=30019 RepID=A0A0M3QTE9_DROBS|nr:CG14007 [Drosophila busckii]ALC38793.1 CG14007 [Drosophila busckii]